MSERQLTIFSCVVCGQPIPEGRTDKRYDKNACRQKMYRWRSAKNRYEEKAKIAIADIAAYLDYPDTYEQSSQILHELRDYVIEVMKAHRVKVKSVK